MESIGNNEISTEFVTAEQLRDMTISKEDRFERDRNNIMTSLFDTMVKLATENGVSSYDVKLNPHFDPVLLSTVKNDLTELGYVVKSEKKDDPQLGKFIALDISWAEQVTSEETTAQEATN